MVEALELLVVEGSSAVIAVDVMVVGIVVAIAAVVGPVHSHSSVSFVNLRRQHFDTLSIATTAHADMRSLWQVCP